jgi:DNA polymerase III psi subunit
MHRKTVLYGAVRAIWSLVRYVCVTRINLKPPQVLLRQVMRSVHAQKHLVAELGPRSLPN